MLYRCYIQNKRTGELRVKEIDVAFMVMILIISLMGGTFYFLIKALCNLLETYLEHSKIKNKYMGHSLVQLEIIAEQLGYINTNLAVKNMEQDDLVKSKLDEINEEIDGDNWVELKAGEPLVNDMNDLLNITNQEVSNAVNVDVITDKEGNQGYIMDDDSVRMLCHWKACNKMFHWKIVKSFNDDMKYCPHCGNKQ